nr:hypothetical protein Q903MT_gene3100 [Picea sitchensis]
MLAKLPRHTLLTPMQGSHLHEYISRLSCYAELNGERLSLSKQRDALPFQAGREGRVVGRLSDP